MCIWAVVFYLHVIITFYFISVIFILYTSCLSLVFNHLYHLNFNHIRNEFKYEILHTQIITNMLHLVHVHILLFVLQMYMTYFTCIIFVVTPGFHRIGFNKKFTTNISTYLKIYFSSSLLFTSMWHWQLKISNVCNE